MSPPRISFFGEVGEWVDGRDRTGPDRIRQDTTLHVCAIYALEEQRVFYLCALLNLNPCRVMTAMVELSAAQAHEPPPSLLSNF